jgi:hypothetical protein
MWRQAGWGGSRAAGFTAIPRISIPALSIGDLESILRFIPLIVILGLMGFVIFKLLTRNKRYKRTSAEVADLLEAFFTATGDPWAFDTLISFPLEDEELEKIRVRCANLDSEFPPETKGRFCNEEGLEVIRGYMSQLRAAAKTGGPR